MKLDFEKKLLDYIIGLDVGYMVNVGSLDSIESVSVNALPGGNIKQKYYDGAADRLLPYEIRFKTKKHKEASDVLASVAFELEGLTELKSDNGSFDFENISITSHPFIVDEDNQNYKVYAFDIQAEITTK